MTTEKGVPETMARSNISMTFDDEMQRLLGLDKLPEGDSVAIVPASYIGSLNARIAELEAWVSHPRNGHNEPCYYCGEPCNALAGNAGRWPVVMFYPDDPGVAKWQHIHCLYGRIAELKEALNHAVRIAEGKQTGTWDDLLPYRALLNKGKPSDG